MAAPDKIYLKGFSGSISQVWSRIKATETSADEQYEYIHKDALLEWAKQKQYDSPTIVQDDFWQEVIDKLNSM